MICAMLKSLGFHFPHNKILALCDWVPFNTMSDHLFVFGKVQRTGLLSRIFKTKTVAVNLICVWSIDEIFSIMYKRPILRDSLIIQSEKVRHPFSGLDVIRSIPIK